MIGLDGNDRVGNKTYKQPSVDEMLALEIAKNKRIKTKAALETLTILSTVSRRLC